MYPSVDFWSEIRTKRNTQAHTRRRPHPTKVAHVVGLGRRRGVWVGDPRIVNVDLCGEPKGEREWEGSAMYPASKCSKGALLKQLVWAIFFCLSLRRTVLWLSECLAIKLPHLLLLIPSHPQAPFWCRRCEGRWRDRLLFISSSKRHFVADYNCRQIKLMKCS